MASRLRPVWKQIQQHRLLTIVIIVVLIVLIAFAMAVWSFGWGWTGFKRTLWDWLGLLAALAIPIVVGFGAAWFTSQQGKVFDAENKDNQREAALQAYIDKISELLLHEHLSESPGNPQVETIARARTVTVLRILDPVRRGSLIQFLSQAGILTKCIEAELSRIDLHGANLTRVNLRKINLYETNLSEANLNFANLSEANLNFANLSEANLFAANLSGADLRRADLRRADLSGADLSGAHLFRSNLSGASLLNANLSRADLSRADLSRAFLSEANLSGAHLSAAKVATEQLDKARSLKGATMPDGSKHP